MIFDEVFQPRKLEDLGLELGTHSQEYRRAKLAEIEFTEIVNMLRQHIANPTINKLMALFWELVGNKISPVGMGSSVKSLSFYCEIIGGQSVGVIFVPDNWHEMILSDSRMQMGACVSAASHAKDYWNHRIGKDSSKMIHERAHSHEAELLHHFKMNDKHFQPNEYQTLIMDKYPLGAASCPHHYEGRDYDAVFPPYPVKA